MPGNPVVHFEIGCQDGSRSRAFFSALFDWEIAGVEAGLTIKTGGASPISGHIGELASEWGNYVIVYVQVDDLEASLTKAAELGGNVLVEPVTLPGEGSFAWIAAPEGNIIGLWKPA